MWTKDNLALAAAHSVTPARWLAQFEDVMGRVAPVFGRVEPRRRAAAEEPFQASKELAGLDKHQVRRWISWHRWVTLSMLAYAFLAILTTTERAHHQPDNEATPLTCNEIRHLLSTIIVRPLHTISQRLRFSAW